LPVEKVDIIISEWMGYFLLYESMLDSVLWARDKYLVKGGKMLPDRATMYIAGIEDGQYKHEKRTFWDDVYGVNMSCVAPNVMREPIIDVVDESLLMTDESKILDLNLCTMKPSEVEFSSEYKFNAKFQDKIHGLVAWWDCEFRELKNPVILSTSPY